MVIEIKNGFEGAKKELYDKIMDTMKRYGC